MARLEYPDEAELDPRSARALEGAPLRLNLFSMLAYAPSLIGPVLRLAGTILTDMDLDPRLRELAILRVGAVTGTPYEVHHHVPIAKQAGVRDDVVSAATSEDRSAIAGVEDLDPVEALVVRLVDETLSSGTPSGSVVDDLKAALGARRLVELVCTVGCYTMIGQVLRALDVDLDSSPMAGSPDQ